MVSRTPVILPPLSSLSDCMKIAFGRKQKANRDIDRADKVDRSPKLMSINGVATSRFGARRSRSYKSSAIRKITSQRRNP